ncbi:NADP oxidoreductase [Bacillus sp. FJAT-27264]|uniref:NADPH-dependent F420 reductase n=1 Tax=Paenibacillus sp. (strain DSM 101736 / FJAT-27264) TaxID=1850362 RepID=UPI000807FB9C|nr:NAD(P)-binding domain-containing protein [Bacillus sp. FJAT-27264]OBZ14180.1 NADP oxidoreductase [Bacillus sp. FJAT-27264]
MKIAIIGTGRIGGNLARVFAKKGHDVAISNFSNAQVLQELAQEIGAKPSTIDHVADGAEVVIISIPIKRISTLPSGFLDKAAPKAVVIDTNNYYPFMYYDGVIEAIEEGLPESRWVEQQLKHPVIKTFNATPWYNMTWGTPEGTPDRLAMPVSGDDPTAKAIVFELVHQVGFDPVDAGGLDESWRQQPGTPVYCVDLDVQGVIQALAAANPERGPESKTLHLSKEMVQAAYEQQSAFYEKYFKACQLLAETSGWNEAKATKAIHMRFGKGDKSPDDILDFVLKHQQLD